MNKLDAIQRFNDLLEERDVINNLITRALDLAHPGIVNILEERERDIFSQIDALEREVYSTFSAEDTDSEEEDEKIVLKTHGPFQSGITIIGKPASGKDNEIRKFIEKYHNKGDAKGFDQSLADLELISISNRNEVLCKAEAARNFLLDRSDEYIADMRKILKNLK